MELRHLRYFLKIAETLSFTRAAGALHITQPTLSHQIRQLERETGQLFDRTQRTVRLTAHGKVFKTYAERAIKEVETGLNALSELDGLVQGRLTVGVYRSFSSSPLPPVLARFSRTYPGVKLFVREANHLELGQRVIDGSLDLAVAYGPAVSEKVFVEQIFTESLALVVGKQHLFYGRPRISLNQLDGQPLVLVNPESRTRQLIDRWLDARGIAPRVMIEMNSNEAVLAMVRCNTVGTICPARTLANTPDLHAVRLPDPPLKRSTVILWRRDSYRSAAARVVAQMVKDAYASAAESQYPAPSMRGAR